METVQLMGESQNVFWTPVSPKTCFGLQLIIGVPKHVLGTLSACSAYFMSSALSSTVSISRLGGVLRVNLFTNC